jgi:K+-transporting ATPase ATPase A chain
MGFAWTIVVLVVLLAISWRFLGSYMAAVFEGRVTGLSLIERPIYRVGGVDEKSEQTWKRYSASSSSPTWPGTPARSAPGG